MSTGWVRTEMDEDQLRQAVMPMIGSYLRVMVGAARFDGAKRKAIEDDCEAEFRTRLDTFAGQHGFFGEDRAFLNEFVANIFDELAPAMEPASQEVEAFQPAADVIHHRHRWWILLLVAAVGALLVMR